MVSLRLGLLTLMAAIASVVAQDSAKCSTLCDRALRVLPLHNAINASQCADLCHQLSRSGGYNDGVG